MPTAPPQYQDPSSEPLLSQAGPSAGGVYNQPDKSASGTIENIERLTYLTSGDLPDDFKYGVSVSESAPEIRAAFVRKVYTILFCQILGTCVVGGAISQSTNSLVWLQQNTWSLIVVFIGTLVNLGLLFWKRHSHPLNLIFLSTFTVLESLTLGVAIAFYDQTVVLQALLITLGIFLGLTLFTFQSKWDFSGMAPFLLGGLVALLVTGIVGVFIPFSKTMNIVYSVGGALLFSGYIVFDTFNINRRLSPDEFILGSISLYLDFVNLFLSILRLLNSMQDR